MKYKCITIIQKQIIMKIIIWWQENYQTSMRIWKDSHGMVLVSPSMSQTRRLVSDFKACSRRPNKIFAKENLSCIWGHVYEGEFIRSDKNYCKVRNHCNYMGKYWGAAHSILNCSYKENMFILVMAHNTSAYDNH